MPAPERRYGPFSRLYGKWVDQLAKTGAGRLQIIVLLCLCERLEFDRHGNASAWYPRAEMAERLGVPERSVSKAVSGLIGKRLLSVKEPGHNGRATVYNVMPGIPWPNRYPCRESVGTSLRNTPKTYRGGGLPPAPPSDNSQDHIVLSKMLPRELW